MQNTSSVRNHWFAWIGVLAIAVQMNVVPISYLLFSSNRAEIARTQCERKAPHCNGHCYLMKQLAKSNDAADKQNQQVQIPSIDPGVLSHPEDYLTLYPTATKLFATPSTPIVPGWTSRNLQPPRVA